MTQDLAHAGLRTLAYAAVFGQGLTFGQLSRFLLSHHRYTTGSVWKVWSDWKSRGWIQRSTVSAQLPHWEKAAAVRQLAAWVPWVQSIWVTGSLAAGTAHQEDDIDFLVITDKNRLWISRLFLVGLSVVFGRARTRYMAEDRVRDRWCFNMWLEPDRVSLPPALQNVYTAREVVQAVPLYVRTGIRAQDFLLSNSWVQKFFARGWSIAYQKAQGRSRSSVTFSLAEASRLIPFDLFNNFAWNWQKKRMDRGKTREIIEKNQAFFHPRDTRASVTKEYERICTLLELKPYA